MAGENPLLASMEESSFSQKLGWPGRVVVVVVVVDVQVLLLLLLMLLLLFLIVNDGWW